MAAPRSTEAGGCYAGFSVPAPALPVSPSRPPLHLDLSFRNAGNTCYVNACLQALLGLPSFAADLEAPELASAPGLKDKSLYRSLLNISQQCQRAHSDAIDPVAVKDSLARTAKHFRGYAQQDAHEFLCYCLDLLQMELRNEFLRNKTAARKSGDGAGQAQGTKAAAAAKNSSSSSSSSPPTKPPPTQPAPPSSSAAAPPVVVCIGDEDDNTLEMPLEDEVEGKPQGQGAKKAAAHVFHIDSDDEQEDKKEAEEDDTTADDDLYLLQLAEECEELEKEAEAAVDGGDSGGGSGGAAEGAGAAGAAESAGAAAAAPMVLDRAHPLCPTSLNFKCLIQHKRTCKACKTFSKPHAEIFHNFSLNVPENVPASVGPVSVQMLLEAFFQDDDVEYKCESCGASDSVIEHKMARLPRILVLHLKRFSFADERGTKIQEPVVINPYLDLG